MTKFEVQSSKFENKLNSPHANDGTMLALARRMNKPPESFQSRSFRFGCAIVRAYMKLAKLPDLPPHLARQVLRAGTAVGANLEEHKGAQTRRDATAKVSIALKEARETSYWLRLLVATNLAPGNLLEPLIDEANQLVAILTVTRRRLNSSSRG